MNAPMDGRAARLGEVTVQQLPDGRRKVYVEEGREYGLTYLGVLVPECRRRTVRLCRGCAHRRLGMAPCPDCLRLTASLRRSHRLDDPVVAARFRHSGNPQ